MEEKENHFAEVIDDENTRNHAVIINGLFSSLTRQKCVVRINWRVIKVVLKISQMPSKLLFSANCSIFGQSWISLGYYPPIYKPPEGFINWLSTHPAFLSSIRPPSHPSIPCTSHVKGIQSINHVTIFERRLTSNFPCSHLARFWRKCMALS